jgi:hypothetical protein
MSQSNVMTDIKSAIKSDIEVTRVAIVIIATP